MHRFIQLLYMNINMCLCRSNSCCTMNDWARCLGMFNAAYGIRITASNTCRLQTKISQLFILQSYAVANVQRSAFFLKKSNNINRHKNKMSTSPTAEVCVSTFTSNIKRTMNFTVRQATRGQAERPANLRKTKRLHADILE